jgi:hypothetical protein
MTYQDVLSCPVFERRFYLQLLLNEGKRRKEMIEEDVEQKRANSRGKGNKGERTTKVSGEQLKAKIMSGEINV